MPTIDPRMTSDIWAHGFSSAIGRFAILCLVATLIPEVHAAATPPVKIAVFDFELEDVSAAGALSAGESSADSARMQAVTEEARKVLAQSGRYSVVNTHDGDPVDAKDKSLRNCDGCDAAVALKLVVNQQAACFTGADDAWASGVRLLLKHGVLTD